MTDVLAYDGKVLWQTINQRVMQLAEIESKYGNRFDNLEFRNTMLEISLEVSSRYFS